MTRRCRDDLPSRAKIAAHWSGRVEEFGVFHDWQDKLSDHECWACGKSPSVQRCHIVPRAEGGADTEENLVLLCPTCHVDSEGVSRLFWRWVRGMRSRRWKTPLQHSLDRFELLGFPLQGTLDMAAQMGADVARYILQREIGLTEDPKIEAVKAELARGTGMVKTARLCGVGTYTVQRIKKETVQ